MHVFDNPSDIRETWNLFPESVPGTKQLSVCLWFPLLTLIRPIKNTVTENAIIHQNQNDLYGNIYKQDYFDER